MKTMMKKYGLIAVIVTLLVAITLVFACSGIGPDTGYNPPDGNGAIKVNLNLNYPTQAKTILPDDLIMGDIAVFALSITPTTGLTLATGTWAGGVAGLLDIDGAADGTSVAPVSSPNIIVDNTTTTYTVSVIAYKDTAKATPLAFGGGTVQAVLNSTTPLDIKLDAYDSTGSGSFSWAIDIDDIVIGNVSLAEITITPISAGGTVAATHSLIGVGALGWESTISLTLNSGYYYVDFAITVSSVPVIFRHILHVYQNMDSHFIYALSDDHFGIKGQMIIVNIISTNPIPDNPLVLTVTDSEITAIPEGTVLTKTSKITLYTDKDNPVTVVPETIVITVSSGATPPVAYTSVNYYTRNTTERAAVGSIITITAGTAPFDTEGLYVVTVEGRVGATPYTPYSEYFEVEIIDALRP